MPLQYEHHCSSCTNTFVSTNRVEEACPLGHRRVQRRFSAPSFHREVGAHFSHSVGKFVNNPRELRDELARGSEEASVDTGIEHHYVMADSRDRDVFPTPEVEG